MIAKATTKPEDEMLNGISRKISRKELGEIYRPDRIPTQEQLDQWRADFKKTMKKLIIEIVEEEKAKLLVANQ